MSSAAPRIELVDGKNAEELAKRVSEVLLNSTNGEERSMPEVIIELAEGRSVEQKRRLVKEITEVVVRVCDVDPQAVIVIIHTNPKTDKAKGGVLFSDR
jgi:4-oxalocrotonate tautomerase